MKTHKLIAMAVLIGALSTAATWAQATWWRIVNGPGAGVILQGNFGFITNSTFGAEQGDIALGHFEDCECEGHDGHYHGTILGVEDNGRGCGWGCVDLVPCDIDQARDALDDAIAAVNPTLAAKLNSILGVAETAISTDCNSLFLGALDAMADELFGAILNGQVTDPQIDALVRAIVEYADFGLQAMGLNMPPPPPPPKPCKVALMLRRGSGAQTKLFDAKRKVNADVGEVVVLEAQGCPVGGTYEWEYKFQGAAKGDVPSRAGISFTPQRFCVLSEKATTVIVTVIYHCPDGKMVRDTATISIQ
jgi:hypothetical protein